MSEYVPNQTTYSKAWARRLSSVKRSWDQGNTLRKSKELFLGSSSDPQYAPLPGPSWIRVLKIETGKPGDVLNCSLRLADLDESPVFTALSYTWRKDPTFWQGVSNLATGAIRKYRQGEQVSLNVQKESENNDMRTIMCNGKPTKVLSNLYDGLVQLRRRGPDDYWIDAICMNQRDVDERTAQVQLMRRIYETANLVIVWLGSTSPDRTTGVDSLEKIAKLGFDVIQAGAGLKNGRYIVPSGLGIDAEELYYACGTAISLASCQWFRRVWVVQELCLAQTVIFKIGDAEMTCGALVSGFNLLRNMKKFTIDEGDEENIFKAFARRYAGIWGSHLLNVSLQRIKQIHQVALLTEKAPKLLDARDTVQNGGMWTLGEWLWLCRGRASTDPRDMVFAGISLIWPRCLTIDQGMQESEIPPFIPFEGDPFRARGCYPQIIPPQGTKPIARSHLEASQSVSMGLPILSPIGLWPALKADYSVDEAEVLVNTAACLMSQTGTAEILSFASRVRQPDMYTSRWLAAPSDKTRSESLPSWVPTPGSWSARVNKNIAFESGTKFLAGGRPSGNPPRISADGTTLFLESSKVDDIEHTLVGMDSIGSLDVLGVCSLLSAIVDLDHWYHGNDYTSVEALARVILGPPRERDAWSTFAKDPSFSLLMALFSRTIQVLGEEYDKIFSPARSRRSKLTTDEFINRREKKFGEKERNTQRLVDLMHMTMQRFGPPEWVKLGFRTIDQNLRIQALRNFHEKVERQAAASQKTAGSKKAAVQDSLAKLREAWKEIANSATKPEAAEQSSLKPDEHVLIDSESPPSSDKRISVDVIPLYREIVHSNLSWRKVFVTRQGYLGTGPEWLNVGDSVIVIPGAPVPFIFTRAERGLRNQEKSVREALDRNNMQYVKFVRTEQIKEQAKSSGDKSSRLHKMAPHRRDGVLKRLDRERLDLEVSLEQISLRLGNVLQNNGGEDAWILLGESYVEGIMHGEFVGHVPKGPIQII